MFIVFKVCFLVAFLWFSSCDANRIKRSVQTSKSIIDLIPGSKSLLPSINITVVIDGCLPTKCCENCPPTTTPEPCPPCPPSTTPEPCTTCPPQTTCKTCEVCQTEAPCKTCDSCPIPTPCETCQTCPPATTGGPAVTCPPPYPGKLCIEAGSFYCPLALGGTEDICITTIQLPKSFKEASSVCGALNETLKFVRVYSSTFNNTGYYKCLSRIVPAYLIDDIKIWDHDFDDDSSCYFSTLKTDGNEIIDTNGIIKTNCNDKYPFICGAIVPK